ncbi:MAG TPA: bifunctional salicylyl-CoA 5-hydroxylase/oxidoreductase [Planctomycetota bacterium]|nr:bifunctional salicylyl-CoA 5-hydroxylase/oxidoreductase [Planctomycetota bacterium]
MKIACIGGGPASLYFAILLKKRTPAVEIDVYEQNKADDTFGWGVVFSDETLGNFETADPESYASIRENFAYWTDIDTFYRGTKVTSTGHGFCGLARKRLLQLLHARCRELGVRLHFQTMVTDIDRMVAENDLVVAADGVNSRVRDRFASSFHPQLDWRKCKFAWFGTTKVMTAFTFVFQPTEWGLFQVHAYPFEQGRGTWIVECREETWRRAGLDELDEAQTAAFCEQLFAEHLAGGKLLTNRSIWRTFPTVRCESWRHHNVVLMGDAAHTAHFSIGSGTKLAMEDSIALADALLAHPTSVPAALFAYEEDRRLDVLKTQRAAQTSLEWFENSERYIGQSPERFVFNLMSRSHRITYDNLRRRDPGLMARLDVQVAREQGAASGDEAPPPAFTPFVVRGLHLHNRIVVSPMCQYSATDGVPDDWHLVHLGSRAVGGAGLVFTEMTNVSARARISEGCAGMWNETQMQAWRRVTAFVHAHSAAKVGMQLAHAGRKGSCSRPWQGDAPLAVGGWPTEAPSALPFRPGWPVPKAMDRADMERVCAEFVRAAQLCERAGFDVIELHMAHGYLLSSFLSPLSNHRGDAYGGALANRARFPLEVLAAVRAAWPTTKPIFVRISATDWFDAEGKGFTVDEAVQLSRWLRDHGADVVDVSSAGNVPESQPQYGRMYQVPFAERIRFEAGMPVMAVGGIHGVDHAHTVVGAGRADLCAIARGFLSDPYMVQREANERRLAHHPWPPQYLAIRR